MKRGKQHRRPRFSSTHNVKHPADNGLSTGLSAASDWAVAGRPVCVRRGV